MKSFVSNSIEDTATFAAQWLKKVGEGDLSGGGNPANVNGEAFVVGLSGPLGAGKTAFVKEVAKLLGIAEDVTSPTFVIMKIYGVDQEKAPQAPANIHRLVHIDAYRLEKGEELEALDFERLVSDSHNLILIEWPENVASALPLEARRLAFSHVGEKSRKIEYNGGNDSR